MSAPGILILGGGIMQLPAVRIARERGWRVTVAAGEVMPAIQELADAVLETDLSQEEAVVAAARELRRRRGLDGVFTAGTDFSTTVARVAEALGLPGIPYQVALGATDKARMRAILSAAGLSCPRFLSTDAVRGGIRLAEGMGFPLVVKPVDNMGARGVRRVDDQEELRAALEVALEASRTGRAIVEEYMDGPELSLDAVVYRGRATVCGVADRHITFPPFFVEMGHTMPSALPAGTLRRVQAAFRRGIQALGIDNGAAKGDIKVTSQGVMVGEIAARLSGGYMSGWTYPLSCGVQVTAAAMNVAVGLPPGELRARFSAVSAERAFISIPGVATAVEGVEQARGVEGVRELFLRVSPGQPVSFPVNNMGKCGNAISQASSRAAAEVAALRAVQSVLVRLEPRHPQTERFLFDTRQGPWAHAPDATEAEGLLEGLPAGGAAAASGQGAGPALVLRDRPELTERAAADWHGMAPAAALARIREITGVGEPESGADGAADLGRAFWRAFLRGGVQGGVYVIDSLRSGFREAAVRRRYLS